MRENLTSGSMRGGWKRGRRGFGDYALGGGSQGSSLPRLSYRASRLLHPAARVEDLTITPVSQYLGDWTD
jgi:hypothetical protein